jgi:hypothetical protein
LYNTNLVKNVPQLNNKSTKTTCRKILNIKHKFKMYYTLLLFASIMTRNWGTNGFLVEELAENFQYKK